MKVDGRHYRTIWLDDDAWSVVIIDQTKLPHEFETRRLESVADAVRAIRQMQVRGAPLIGATAAYGMCLAARIDPSDAALAAAAEALLATRPTAVNLVWAVDAMMQHLTHLPPEGRSRAAYGRAAALCDEDVATNRRIGDNGLALIAAAAQTKAPGEAVNILTHCNAGWLATVDWGTALAPVYRAHGEGVSVHVWVDETRPRNQGARLTAWELGMSGVPHTVVVDNAGGHLMQLGHIDMCLVGTDRTTAQGDVCNKIGTYLKALAAHDNRVPFYVAVPPSSIDWQARAQTPDLPIEERPPEEVTHIVGRGDDGEVRRVALTPPGTAAKNYAFDVTPARLITALITDRGTCRAAAPALAELFNAGATGPGPAPPGTAAPGAAAPPPPRKEHSP